MVTLKYFGVIAEKTNRYEETFDDIKLTSLFEFIENIKTKYQLNNESFSVVVNQEIKNIKENDILIQENDTIALLPPFSGG